MKKMLLGLSSVLLVVGSSVMGMKSVIGTKDPMKDSAERSHSAPSRVVSPRLLEVTTMTTRPSSAPVTRREIDAAIKKCAHLVPINKTADLVNSALITAITHIDSEDIANMSALVNLICSSYVAKEYAHYVQNVYSYIDFAKCKSDNPYKYGRMLSAIADNRGGGGGTDPSLYWSRYNAGFYNPCLPVGDDGWDE